MTSGKEISRTVDTWIVQEELPVRANLKVIRKNDPDYGLTNDEIKDRNECIRCYLLQGYEGLLMIPKNSTERDFFLDDCEVTEHEYSAFSTVNFQRISRPFDRYGYAMKKIMERVRELAILHSCVSLPEDRLEIHNRYETIVDRRFRYRLLSLVKRYRATTEERERFLVKRKIAELNRRILECRKIWERYAPPENWDR